MSNDLPAQRVPLQFLYMCMHDVSGYFRRADGHALNISTMKSPYEPGFIFDPRVDPQFHPQVVLLLRICFGCKRLRQKCMQGVGQYYRENPALAPREQAKLERMRRQNLVHDSMLMKRALKHYPGSIVAGGAPPAENNHTNDTNKLQRLRSTWVAILKKAFHLIVDLVLLIECLIEESD